MSLLELVIAVALFGIVTTVLAVLITASQRSFRRVQPQAAAQQAALMVSSRLREELRTALPESVAVLPAQRPDPDGGNPLDRDAIAFFSSRGPSDELQFNETGELLWQKRVVIYALDGDVRLQQTFIPPSAEPAIPVHPDYAPQPADRLLTTGIRRLHLTWTPPRLAIEVEARVQGGHSLLQTSAVALMDSISGPSPSP